MKKEIEELHKALEAGGASIDDQLKSLVSGGVMEVHDVDYLEVEYLQLPITCIVTKFMVRFSKPIPMVLTEKIIKIPYDSHDHTLEGLKKESLNIWNKMINMTRQDVEDEGGGEDEEANKIMEKWTNITEVRLVEMELKRKPLEER